MTDDSEKNKAKPADGSTEHIEQRMGVGVAGCTARYADDCTVNHTAWQPMTEDFAYSDIINLPCHVSKKRPQMSMYDRAAQFAPFAALTGHEDSIKETEKASLERIVSSEAGEMFIEDC